MNALRWLLATLALLFTVTMPRAHDWFEVSCCSQNDCAAAKPGEVRAAVNGWWVGREFVPSHDRRVRAIPPDAKAPDGSRPQGIFPCIRFGQVICLYVGEAQG